MADRIKIATAIPIKNSKFNIPTRATTTIDTATQTSVGANSFVFDHTTYKFQNTFQRGDTLVLGPSTVTTYAGKTETVTIESITAATGNVSVNIREQAVNSYADGDPVVGYGSKLAAGWFLSNTTEVSAGVTQIRPDGIKPPGGGYLDNYGQKIIFDPDTSPVFDWFESDFDSNPFIGLEGVYCRLGLRYKTDITIGSGAPPGTRFYCEVHDQSQSGFDGRFLVQTISTSDAVTWTEFASSSFPIAADMSGWASGSYSAIGNGKILLVFASKDDTDSLTVWIDDTYLEHAQPIATEATILDTFLLTSSSGFRVEDNSGFSVSDSIILLGEVNPATGSNYRGKFEGTVSSVGTDGQIMGVTLTSPPSISSFMPSGSLVRKKNNGYYEIPDFPTMGSTQWQRVSASKFSRDAGMNLRSFNPFGNGDITEKYMVQMNYDNVSTTILDNLIKFLNWQDNGHFVNIHLGDNFPELPRKFLTGRMSITNVKHNIWDTQKTSFTISVME